MLLKARITKPAATRARQPTKRRIPMEAVQRRVLQKKLSPVLKT
jgi:hypothetical protein